MLPPRQTLYVSSHLRQVWNRYAFQQRANVAKRANHGLGEAQLVWKVDRGKAIPSRHEVAETLNQRQHRKAHHVVNGQPVVQPMASRYEPRDCNYKKERQLNYHCNDSPRDFKVDSVPVRHLAREILGTAVEHAHVRCWLVGGLTLPQHSSSSSRHACHCVGRNANNCQSAHRTVPASAVWL